MWLVSEYWLTNSAFWQTIPFGQITIGVLLFWAGVVAQDLYSQDSWVRRKWAALRQMFVVESVVAQHRTDPSKEYLVLALTVRMTRNVREASFVMRVHEGVNHAHVDRVFVLESSKMDIVKDQSKRRALAIIPLKRHDGAPLGYQVWGDKFRESGDVSGRSILVGSDNVVEIEMRKRWRRQTERLFIASLHGNSHEFGKVFVVTSDHRTGLRVTPTF